MFPKYTFKFIEQQCSLFCIFYFFHLFPEDRLKKIKIKIERDGKHF